MYKFDLNRGFLSVQLVPPATEVLSFPKTAAELNGSLTQSWHSVKIEGRGNKMKTFQMVTYYLTQCSRVDLSLPFLSEGEHVKVDIFQMFLPEVHLLNGIQFILSVHVSRCSVHSHAEMYLSNGPTSHITHNLPCLISSSHQLKPLFDSYRS